jgi:hypothetical protein
LSALSISRPLSYNLKLMSGFMTLLRELFAFLKQEKKWWLIPLCVTLVLLTTLIIVAESSALAPFVYSLF